MPMNLEAVGAVSEPGRTSWTSKDALLYALGVGAGQTDPTGFELEFTTENSMNIEQRVLPTMPVIIVDGWRSGPAELGRVRLPHAAARRAGRDGARTDPARRRGRHGVADRRHLRQGQGRGRSASRTPPTYVDSGKPAFTTRFAAFIRGEGGFGESRGDEIADPPKAPERAPDHEVTYATRADQALLYRLSRRPQPAALRPGDREVRRLRTSDPPRPLHVRRSPAARCCTSLCGSDVAKFKSMDARFSKPVMPGDIAHREDVGGGERLARSSRPSTRTVSSSSTAAASTYVLSASAEGDGGGADERAVGARARRARCGVPRANSMRQRASISACAAAKNGAPKPSATEPAHDREIEVEQVGDARDRAADERAGAGDGRRASPRRAAGR